MFNLMPDINSARTFRLKAIILVALLFTEGFASAKELVLAEGGKTEYAIVVDEQAHAAEQTAASEIKKYLEQSTGAVFPLFPASKAQPDSRKIYVGFSEEVRRLVPEIDPATLGEDGIVIKTVGTGLILAGGEPRGALNAVYTFLQEELGCRWYADDMEEVIPRHSRLVLAPKDVVYQPPFQLRWLYTVVAAEGESKDPLFPAKFRVNGGTRPLEYGGGIHYGGSHTMDTWVLPSELFFADHPDWYAMNRDGERYKGSPGSSIPCYSNKQALEKAKERVLEHLEVEYPKWNYPSQKVLSISHPDVAGHCHCPDCEATFSEYGTQAAALLIFVNAIAEETAKQYPDVKISTLAYWNTAAPPIGLKAHDQVLIHFGISNGANHWENGKNRVVMRDFRSPFHENPVLDSYLEGWSLLTRHLYVWDYYTNFRNMLQPHPSWFAFPESFPRYRELKVSGIFAQGGWAVAGDFPRLSFWVGSQMLWNPDRDPRALVAEFLNAYYQAAGPLLLEYLETMAAVEAPLRSFAEGTAGWLTLQRLNEATLLFDKAEALVAESPKHRQRVRRARFGLDLVWLERYEELRTEAQRTGLPFRGPEDPVAEVERVAANEFKVKVFREWAGFEEYVASLRKLHSPHQGEKK